VDAQRAMREARYAAQQAQASTGRRTASAQPTPAQPTPRERPAQADRRPPEPGPLEAVVESVCGHRNIGNKQCQRPAGHSEKSHRYR
jgi:hypothetical protein